MIEKRFRGWPRQNLENALGRADRAGATSRHPGGGDHERLQRRRDRVPVRRASPRAACDGRERGTPHVVPVGMWSHNSDHDTIDVTGHDFARAKKYRDLRRQGRAAIVVDDIASVSPWRVRGSRFVARPRRSRSPSRSSASTPSASSRGVLTMMRERTVDRAPTDGPAAGSGGCGDQFRRCVPLSVEFRLPQRRERPLRTE
jgi:hypothetical protein